MISLFVQRFLKNVVERAIAIGSHFASYLPPNPPPISVSVGVSLCGQTDNPQDRFNDADVALYYVKDHGRHGCCFFAPGMQEK